MSMKEHELYRDVVQTYRYEVVESDGGSLRIDRGSAAFVDENQRKTVVCACGERFRKDRTALEHVESGGDSA